MDQEKIKALAEAAEKGYDVQYDSLDEAKAVEAMLQAKSSVGVGRPSDVIDLQNPQKTSAGPNMSHESFMKGAIPGIMDYAPALGVAGDALTGEKQALGSKYQSMTPEEKQDLVVNLGSYSDKERHEILRDLVKLNFQREIEKNKASRAEAYKNDKMSYGMGAGMSGALLGAAGGMAAGPSMAGQGLAGMATGLAMDPSPESGLAGAAGGMAAAAVPNAIGSGIRKTGNTLANLSATDAMIGDWLNLDAKQIVKLKASGDWDELMQVVRAHEKFAGPQAMLEDIQMPAIRAGAEGTLEKPIVGPQKVGQIDAEMSAMPTQAPRPQHPSSWQRPPKGGRSIDMETPEGTEIYHGKMVRPGRSMRDPETGELIPGTFEPPIFEGGASSEELNAISPAHPSADKLLAPRGKQIPPPGPQEVQLDVIEEPSAPPLSPMERLASEHLAGVANRGKDLVHQTPHGWFNRTMANRVAPGIGFTAPKMGQAMLNVLDSQGARMAVGGLEGAVSQKLRQLILTVWMGSENPELEDYLAQEMSAPYKAVRMEAQHALEEENK